MKVHVKERENTGEAHFAGGYNTLHKLFINAGVKKRNFLGLDQSLSLQLTLHKYQERFSFSYHNPYLMDSLWSLSFSLFNVGQEMISGLGGSSLPFLQNQDYSSYSQQNTGFSVSLGRHITDFFTMFLKYRLQKQKFGGSVYFLRNLPILSPAFEFLFGKKEQLSQSPLFFDDIYKLDEAKGWNSSLSATWEYDKRNDRYYASKGFFYSSVCRVFRAGRGLQLLQDGGKSSSLLLSGVETGHKKQAGLWLDFLHKGRSAHSLLRAVFAWRALRFKRV